MRAPPSIRTAAHANCPSRRASSRGSTLLHAGVEWRRLSTENLLCWMDTSRGRSYRGFDPVYVPRGHTTWHGEQLATLQQNLAHSSGLFQQYFAPISHGISAGARKNKRHVRMPLFCPLYLRANIFSRAPAGARPFAVVSLPFDLPPSRGAPNFARNSTAEACPALTATTKGVSL